MAGRLVASHGLRARQIVVDNIVSSIRANDLEAAKRWDRVGELVDDELGALADA